MHKAGRFFNSLYPGFCRPLRAGIAITLSGLLGHSRGQRMDRFGLAPCGVYRAVCVAANAVGSYPTISPLPLRAVCFLLHFPSNGVIWPRRPALSGGALPCGVRKFLPLRLKRPGAAIWAVVNSFGFFHQKASAWRLSTSA